MEIVDSVYDQYQQNYEKIYDISDLIIPFGKIFKKTKQLYIYSGTERIPFKERDTEFKVIFRQEFSEV
ncbi:hypothetical protein LCGC14_2913040 [marine sediment metagenome]|uniref:Uncharacterized protein n=1 Tax=marine sediment metagenome TaxID=412755 RepID=A0A0F8XR40_9ZZZZ